MIYKLFMTPALLFAPEGANPQSDAAICERFPAAGDIKHNVLYWRSTRVTLASGTSYTIPAAEESSSDWFLVIVRVVGTAKILSTMTDWDGVTALTGVTPASGTVLMPGFAMLTYTNAASPTIQSLANGTVIDIFSAVLAADNDVRLTDNA